MALNPFTDFRPKNAQLVPVTGYRFLKTRVTVNGTLTNPDPFTYANVVRIEDPDGNDVTSAWVTKVADPNQTDPYTDAHATYVGDDAGADVNKGLFADGAGHIAIKVLVPSGAEVTSNNPERNYRIFWDIRINTNPILDADGENAEDFNVTPAGILDFGTTWVTAPEIKQNFDLGYPDEVYLGAATEAQCIIHSLVLEVGCTIPADITDSLRCATLYLTRWLLLDQYGGTRGESVNAVSQGGMSLTFSSVDQRLERLDKLWRELLQAFLAARCGTYGKKIPKMFVGSNFEGTRYVTRDVLWAWRDL